MKALYEKVRQSVCPHIIGIYNQFTSLWKIYLQCP